MRSSALRSASGTPRADMNTVRSGPRPPSALAPSTIACAASVARVTSGGMKMTISASIPGSSPTMRMASR